VIAALARARHDGTESSPAVNPCPAEDLELPGPLRLLLTAGWNLGESVGLPVAAYVAAAWLDDHDTGLVAGLVAIWLTAAIRKVVTGAVPSLLTISAVVLTLQTALVLATGDLWLFPLQFPLGNLCMCVLFARTARGPNPLVAKLAAEVVAPQCGLQRNLTPGHLRQRLQNLDVSVTPVPRQVISHAERADHAPVRAMRRKPGPRDHAHCSGQARAAHPKVQPRAAEDQFLPGVDHAFAQCLLGRALPVGHAQGA
jgi:hypothetical protein